MKTGLASHPELGQVPFRSEPMSDWPDDQVAFTIERMRKFAVVSAITPELQRDLRKALELSDGEPLTGIHRFVRQSLRFAEDEDTLASVIGEIPDRETTIETLIAPVDLSDAIDAGLTPSEDCDGFATYVAALLETAGIPCAFVTVAADADDKSRFSHVYVVAYPIEGVRIPIDASHGPHVGWEVPNRFGRQREWPLRQTKQWWKTVALIAVLGGAVWIGTRD